MSTDNAKTLLSRITDPSVTQIGNIQVTHKRDYYGEMRHYGNGQEFTFKGNEIRVGGELVKTREVSSLAGLCKFGTITNVPGLGDIRNDTFWEVKTHYL